MSPAGTGLIPAGKIATLRPFAMTFATIAATLHYFFSPRGRYP
jgi:hypothetical protein